MRSSIDHYIRAARGRGAASVKGAANVKGAAG